MLELPGTKTASTVDASKTLLFEELEAVIDKLTNDIMAGEKAFFDRAVEMNTLDKLVRENQNKIFSASKELDNQDKARDRLNYQLGFLEEQQKELTTFVDELEKDLGLSDWSTGANVNFLPTDRMYLEASDVKRQSIMQLLVSVDAQVKQADEDIRDIIEHVNSLRSELEVTEDMSTADTIRLLIQKQVDHLLRFDRQTNDVVKRTEKLARDLKDIKK